MVTVEEVRRLALALPEVTEQDHHGRPSFRVRGKIFATVPGPDTVNLMVPADAVAGIVTEDPAACAELWWSTRLSGVRLHLPAASAALAAELLADAWQSKAPTTLARGLDRGWPRRAAEGIRSGRGTIGAHDDREHAQG